MSKNSPIKVTHEELLTTQKVLRSIIGDEQHWPFIPWSAQDAEKVLVEVEKVIFYQKTYLGY